MSKRKEAENLYSEIQQAYSSPYFPCKEERDQAMIILTRLVMKTGYDKNGIISKAKHFAMMHGNHKTKITNLITNEFWLHKLDIGVQARKFKDED